MKLGFLILLISTFSLIATAEQSADGKIRQGNGVSRASAELATQDLIHVCLAMPLIQSDVVTFDGIESLKFTVMPDGSTFAYAKCVYKPASK